MKKRIGIVIGIVFVLPILMMMIVELALTPLMFMDGLKVIDIIIVDSCLLLIPISASTIVLILLKLYLIPENKRDPDE